MTDTDTALSGELRHRARRRSFWTFSLAGIALAFPVGIATGYLLRQGQEGTYSPVAALILIALSLAAFVWFAIGYYRRVDELDFADNLWAAFIALHVLLVAYPVWKMLDILEMAPPPNAEQLWFGTIIACFVAYGWRKLRNR